MMEFLVTWGTAIGIFLFVGTLMQALNKTIGGVAGDEGLKGFWYSWKRFVVLPLGALLGSLAPLVGLSSPFGEGIGAGILDGLIAAGAAGEIYTMLIGSLKARVKHKLAKNGKKE